MTNEAVETELKKIEKALEEVGVTVARDKLPQLVGILLDGVSGIIKNDGVAADDFLLGVIPLFKSEAISKLQALLPAQSSSSD